MTKYASSSFSLFGIDINCRLSLTDHVRTECNKASKKMGLFYKTWHFCNSNKLSTIYKSNIRSQMKYCSPLWDGAGHVVFGRLDRLQNCAITLINDRRVTNDIPSLRKNVAFLSLLYRYFHGPCSGELHDMVPSPLACPRVTRGLIGTRRFSLSPSQVVELVA